MRLVLQRVLSSSVEVGGVSIASIPKGLLVLVGIGHNDTEKDADWLAGKLVNLRIFNDSENKMNNSLLDMHGELLLVSQFTLLASTQKGNRPSFIQAAPPDVAHKLYGYFVEQCRSKGVKVSTGEFGADMKVSLVNDGPVTLIMDSKE